MLDELAGLCLPRAQCIHALTVAGNPGGTDVLAGTPLEQSEIAPLLTFLAEISETAPGRLPADFSWSSAMVAQS